MVDTAAEFYSNRVPRKERKRTLVDELMTDANFQRLDFANLVSLIEKYLNSFCFIQI